MEQSGCLTSFVKAEALRLGFDACGVACAAPVPVSVQRAYDRWVEQGMCAGMDYLVRNREKRFDPRLLVEGTRSIVCVALNYYPGIRLEEDQYQLAWYAYGQDYHEVMKARLRQLLERVCAAFPEVEGRAFCDTAPVLERYWAVQAGIGWIGRNTQLIIPHGGSTFFLGELFLNAEMQYDVPLPGRCGTCEACRRSCPASALFEDPESGYPCLDARRCLSYLTIENREAIPEDAAGQMGMHIYGCDSCLRVCPHLRFASPTREEEFALSDALRQMRREDWESLTEEQYRTLFKGSAVKRAKFEGLKRNIEAVRKRKV